MALGGVTLSYGLRNGLSSLKTTNDAINIANLRLSTGKRVNSPLDNAVAYFTSQGLTSRAKSMSLVSDNIGLSLRTFEAANKSLESIKTLLDAAAGQLRQAQQSSGTNVKIVSAQAFVDASGNADPSKVITGGTGANDLTTLDNFTIAMSAGVTLAATAIGAVAAGTTVQNYIDAINNNVSFNPAGIAPRVRAYQNEAGNIVIESVRSDVNVVFNQTANGGTANVLTSTWSIKGDPNKTFTVTGAAGAQTTSVVSAANNATRAAIAAGFRTTLDQITALSRDAGYNGTNLLDGDTLKTNFNVEGTTSLITKGVTANANYFGFVTDSLSAFTGDSVYGFQSDREIRQALDKVTAATDSLTALQSQFSQNLSIINMRKDFTASMIKTLDEGGDDLVTADINAEGAALTALQTRQALAVQALALASQSDQAILRLF